jgi:GTPase
LSEINIITKSGYVALIGKPNVGKSTLLNSILDTKISIVTKKPQTTRRNVLGILSTDTTQIVFIDTPGVLKPKYELHRKMLDYIDSSLDEADIIVVLIDCIDYQNSGEYFPESFVSTLKKASIPAIAVINKIDLLKNVKEVLPIIDELNNSKVFKEIVPISALKNASIKELLATLEKYLPEMPFYFDSELLSTQSERFFVSEIIRRQVFEAYGEEIPYSTDILIREFKERSYGKWYIAADIVVERQSQKAIIIGAKGLKLKHIGEQARREIEEHLGTEIFLELFVKVRPNWRNDKSLLSQFGY